MTFTKEQLIARINQVTAINKYRISRDPDADGLAMDNELFAIALASLEAEAAGIVRHIELRDPEQPAGIHVSLYSKLDDGVVLYTAPPAPVVPETLPCPVMLEPGLRFGKGVRTQTMLDALQRRAEYSAELEAMTPEQRADQEAGMKEFAAMLQGAEPVSQRDKFTDDIVSRLAWDLVRLGMSVGDGEQDNEERLHETVRMGIENVRTTMLKIITSIKPDFFSLKGDSVTYHFDSGKVVVNEPPERGYVVTCDGADHFYRNNQEAQKHVTDAINRRSAPVSLVTLEQVPTRLFSEVRKFGYLSVDGAGSGLRVVADYFHFSGGTAPTDKVVGKYLLQGVINYMQEYCDSLSENDSRVMSIYDPQQEGK